MRGGQTSQCLELGVLIRATLFLCHFVKYVKRNHLYNNWSNDVNQKILQDHPPPIFMDLWDLTIYKTTSHKSIN